MLGEIDWGRSGLRARIAAASEPPWTLPWLIATIAAAAAFGAMVGKGEEKLAIVPVAGLLAVFFSRLPAAGYVAILWSVGTAVDMLALPQVGISSLRFEPAEVLLWIALGSLVFMPADVRRVVTSLLTKRESLMAALFLAAVIAGVAVGVENGASLHTAALDMRLMLVYAAFWRRSRRSRAAAISCSSWSRQESSWSSPS